MKNKFNFMGKNLILLSCFILLTICLVGHCQKACASENRITLGSQVMAYIFDNYPDCSFLVKYRKDKKFVGVLIVNLEDKKESIVKIFDTETGLEAFDYAQKDKEITDFNYKKNAVVLTYKSTFWEEKAAFDIISGRFVRRYSSLLTNINTPKQVEK